MPNGDMFFINAYYDNMLFKKIFFLDICGETSLFTSAEIVSGPECLTLSESGPLEEQPKVAVQ